jgi:hypothetical protein
MHGRPIDTHSTLLIELDSLTPLADHAAMTSHQLRTIILSSPQWLRLQMEVATTTGAAVTGGCLRPPASRAGSLVLLPQLLTAAQQRWWKCCACSRSRT